MGDGVIRRGGVGRLRRMMMAGRAAMRLTRRRARRWGVGAGARRRRLFQPTGELRWPLAGAGDGDASGHVLRVPPTSAQARLRLACRPLRAQGIHNNYARRSPLVVPSRDTSLRSPLASRHALRATAPRPEARGNMPGGGANHITGEGICLEGEPLTLQGREYA
eukprot:8420600-Pyramimonas_sp.AAC.1